MMCRFHSFIFTKFVYSSIFYNGFIFYDQLLYKNCMEAWEKKAPSSDTSQVGLVATDGLEGGKDGEERRELVTIQV